MNIKQVLTICFSFILAAVCYAKAAPVKSRSVYQQKPEDRDAIYFTSDNFKIAADGKTDVSDALQDALNQVKTKYNFGIVFLPEGKYLISKTIYIPQAVRLIGYGKNRPQIILAKNSPGYQTPDTTDKGQAKYMFWFTSGVVRPGQPVRDANASTFYSAISNVDLAIEDGNPTAVALRAHFAQHSFIAHVDINIGNGKAGLYDVGNEMEDVRFFGGEYGIYTTKPSPGWQFMTIDTYFEGQRKAAIKTREAGLTMVRMSVKNVPIGIDIDLNHYEKLFMEDCRFDKISGAAISIGMEDNATNQISLRNIDCRNVPVFAGYKHSGKQTPGKGAIYQVKNFIYGLQMDDLNADAAYRTTAEMEVLKTFPPAAKSDIPVLPDMKTWVNLQALGAKGDGTTDDTKAIQDAIDKYPVIYVPQGWYRVSETIKLKANSVLIGLNPIATQILLADDTEGFGGFGTPKPMIEAPKGGTNILTGIGLYTGIYNNRAVACKWMAGSGSYMNDVKFIGGHGTMAKPTGQPRNTGNQPRTRNAEDARTQQGIDEAWNTQYPSLWVTDGGGGTFTDIWSANTFANAGVYVSNTTTPGRVYALSVEHHVLNEVIFNSVSNWKVYALQTEEENRESSYCQALELQNCSNMVFANLYMYRVTRVNIPYPNSVRMWDCKNLEFLNLHNFSQTKFTSTTAIYDVTDNTDVRPWEFVRLHIGESAPKQHFPAGDNPDVTQLAKGFEYADGITQDSKGNIYFCETRLRRIYKWSAQNNLLSLLPNVPWEPLALAVDKNDQLLVVFKYFERDGHPSSGTSTSGWGYTGFTPMVYEMNPGQPEESMKLLKKVPMGSIFSVSKALYPANRGVGFYDYDTNKLSSPKEMFIAFDGATIIPATADLFRANALQEAVPGKALYASDELNKRTVKLKVGVKGTLSDLEHFAEKGEYSTAVDASGNVYIADGNIYVYDKNGAQIREIKTPERPATILLSADGKTLFFTGRSAFYKIAIH